VIAEAIRRQGEVCGDPERWSRILAQVETEMGVGLVGGGGSAESNQNTSGGGAKARNGNGNGNGNGNESENEGASSSFVGNGSSSARAITATTSTAAVVAVLENNFLKVYVDLAVGIQSVFDKGTGKNYSLKHELVAYVTLSLWMYI
jgi:hypothetical protein